MAKPQFKIQDILSELVNEGHTLPNQVLLENPLEATFHMIKVGKMRCRVEAVLVSNLTGNYGVRLPDGEWIHAYPFEVDFDNPEYAEALIRGKLRVAIGAPTQPDTSIVEDWAHGIQRQVFDYLKNLPQQHVSGVAAVGRDGGPQVLNMSVPVDRNPNAVRVMAISTGKILGEFNYYGQPMDTPALEKLGVFHPISDLLFETFVRSGPVGVGMQFQSYERKVGASPALGAPYGHSHQKPIKLHGSYISEFDYSKAQPDVSAPGCRHSWKRYVGLNETFDYCEHCDAKSILEPK